MTLVTTRRHCKPLAPHCNGLRRQAPDSLTCSLVPSCIPLSPTPPCYVAWPPAGPTTPRTAGVARSPPPKSRQCRSWWTWCRWG
jgi:hypothetical protein